MSSSIIHARLASLGINCEKLVDPPRKLRCKTVVRIELQRVEYFPTGMGPTAGMHHANAAHFVVCDIAVSLQNALELAQEFFGPSRPRPIWKSKTTLPPGRPYCHK